MALRDGLDSKQVIPPLQEKDPTTSNPSSQKPLCISLTLHQKKKMQHNKPSTTFCKSYEKMAATAPVAIGTRGTVGSLVKKEIDYFAKIELERCSSSSSSQRPQGPDMASSSCSSSPPTFWHSVMSWRRKKKRTSNHFVPKICSAFDASESNRLNKISGFSYTILQNDFHSFHM